MKIRRLLPTNRHAVFRLAPGLLLVFKPRGHSEARHMHPRRQRLRVLRGQLVVRTDKRTVALLPSSRPFTLAAGRAHATVAVEHTWLIAESLAPRRRL